MKNTTKRGWIGAVAVFAALVSAPALVAVSQDPPAEDETCDRADGRHRDAKLKLKEMQLARDAEGIRLAERELEAARVEYCNCLRRIHLATKVMPDNFEEICYPKGRRLIEPPRKGQTGKDRQIGPVTCGAASADFQLTEKAWIDAGRPLDFEPGSVSQQYADARKALCECLKQHYGNKMSKQDREFCKEPSDTGVIGGKKPNVAPPAPPVQIDPNSPNPPGTETGPPQGENPPQAPGQPRAPRTGTAPPPPPPLPPANPNAPAPPGPGLPAPPGPGMPAADCLREGAWNFTFTVEFHDSANHNHEDCVKFLRRVLKAIFGNFAGDLFSAKFEDLLPEMQCTKIPGCSGNCKGTLPQFAGKENVEFEIQDLRRNGDTITGKLVVTSGGQRLFVLRFTATPAVAP